MIIDIESNDFCACELIKRCKEKIKAQLKQIRIEFINGQPRNKAYTTSISNLFKAIIIYCVHNYSLSLTYPDDLMKSISSTLNHIAPGIDNVPTKDSQVTDQRIDVTNEHLTEISRKLDIIIDILKEIKKTCAN